MKSFALGAIAALILASAASAGEQYIDRTGFAVSGYDVVAYRSLQQAPVGKSQPAAVPGRADITAEYNGARFAFASTENRDRFLANPAFYVPQYDGHCAYGVAKGGKAPGNPNLWRIVDDKLYLNVTRNVAGFWEQDISGNLNRAEGNWPGIEQQAASDRVIPGFTSTAPAGD
ncbi:YHS domain-containing (seleno)protein [Phycobacter sp. K97]|uniref:YHS domain-containing (seleno)protein n=1 Tax=Phycobacter sedimenti TaxID=3133977 RepID=UPI00311E95F4